MDGREETQGEEVTDLLTSGVLEAPRLEMVDFPMPKEIVLSISSLISPAVAVIL